MSASTPTPLKRFERRITRHAVNATYAVVMEERMDGLGVTTFRVHVERKNPGNLGVRQGLWEYRQIADLETARRIANSHWTELRDGKCP